VKQKIFDYCNEFYKMATLLLVLLGYCFVVILAAWSIGYILNGDTLTGN